MFSVLWLNGFEFLVPEIQRHVIKLASINIYTKSIPILKTEVNKNKNKSLENVMLLETTKTIL